MCNASGRIGERIDSRFGNDAIFICARNIDWSSLWRPASSMDATRVLSASVRPHEPDAAQQFRHF
jgi:hypothetical protein